MGDSLTVYYVDLKLLELPPDVREAAEKFAKLQKGESEGILSMDDFEALDQRLQYSPEEYGEYCNAMRTLYKHIGAGFEDTQCIPGVTKFTELSKTVVSGFAMKSVSKAQIAEAGTFNSSDEAKLAALEYVGRILLMSLKLERFRKRMEENGYELSTNGNHYTIKRNDVLLEFDTQALKSGTSAIDNLTIKMISGAIVPADEWPKFLVNILSYTNIFKDLFYCNWRLLDSGLILFKTDSSELGEFARIYLKVLSDVLLKYPQIELTIIGNADRAGGAERNEDLASLRAEMVKAELVRLGVKEDRLKTVSMGEDRPIDADEDNVRNQHNRNVQIIAGYRYSDGSYSPMIVYKQEAKGNILLTTDIKAPEDCKVSTTGGTHSTFGEKGCK